jgi:hypothetical protein
VLPGASGSGRAGAGARSALLEGAPGSVQRGAFDQHMRAAARVFELASGEVGLELPLCIECAGEVHRELEAQLAELQQVGTRDNHAQGVGCQLWRKAALADSLADSGFSVGWVGRLRAARGLAPSPSAAAPPLPQEVSAYEAALQRLEAGGSRPLDQPALQREVDAAQGELARERCAAVELPRGRGGGVGGRTLAPLLAVAVAAAARAPSACTAHCQVPTGPTTHPPSWVPFLPTYRAGNARPRRSASWRRRVPSWRRWRRQRGSWGGRSSAIGTPSTTSRCG